MIKSRQEALAILAKLQEYDPKKAISFFDPKFPEQARFVNDTSFRIGVLCSRRAGKSYGIGLKLFKAAFENPGTTCVYIGLTRQTAKEIMWRSVVKELNKKFDTKASFNETELAVTFPNESRIRLIGLDKDEGEMHKVLGQAPSLVVIDEAGSFRQDLRMLCYEMIEPSLTDNDGTLCLVGTPTDLIHSLFFDVTNGKEPLWNLHKWNTTQNPYIKDKWGRRLEILKQTNPRIEETPSYKRMYLGEWVEDLSKLVYKYKPEVNDCDKLPPLEVYTYALGVDLGYNDATAFSLGAYSEHDPNFYIVSSYKQSGLIFSEVAEKIKELQRKYPISSIIIDGANKQGVEEMRRRYHIPLLVAEKQGKAEYIELMNSDYITGRIKILPDNDELRKELTSLIWDESVTNKKVEHPSCANHLADSSLYVWRASLSYLSEPREREKTVEDRLEEWVKREEEKIERESNKDELIDYINEIEEEFSHDDFTL